MVSPKEASGLLDFSFGIFVRHEVRDTLEHIFSINISSRIKDCSETAACKWSISSDSPLCL